MRRARAPHARQSGQAELTGVGGWNKKARCLDGLQRAVVSNPGFLGGAEWFPSRPLRPAWRDSTPQRSTISISRTQGRVHE